MYSIYREQLRNGIDRLGAMRNRCLAEKRRLTPAELAESERLVAELAEIERGLDLENKLQDSPAMRQSAHPPLKPDPGAAEPGHHPLARAKFAGGDKAGFNTLGDYFRALVCTPGDQRLERQRIMAMEAGSFSEGGALVPDGFSNEIINLIIERSPILSRADVYPMTTATLKIPAVDDTNHATNRAGLVARWTAEGGEISPDEIGTRQIALTPSKLTLLVKCSREFLQDAVNAQRFATGTMTTEAAFTIDAVLIGGTGAGQPQGILNCPNLLTTLKQVGALAGSFAWEDALAMYQNANPAGDEGLIWLFSPSLKTQVLSMSMGIGTAGVGFFPALREASGNLTLLSKPVFWTEHCRRAGQVGDALLVNPRSLAVGIRQQVQIDTSEHVFFTTDHVAFRLTMRIDAQSKYSEGLTLSDGVTRVSDLVTLEARA